MLSDVETACDEDIMSGICEMYYGDGVTEPTNWKRGGLIGRGGSGSVFDVTSDDSNWYIKDQLAVKQFMIRPEYKNKKLAEFERETSILSNIRHQRIVFFYGCTTTDGVLSIFIEKMHLGSLDDYLYSDSNVNLMEEEIQQITRQLLEGLSYLHSKKIMHRDVKGANVLLQDKFNVKLTDFGVSKLLLDQSKANTSNIGTYRWMAPEMFMPQCYTYAVDIWSLGCTVLQMINREPPFDDLPELQMVLFKLGSEDPSPLYRLQTHCSHHMKALLNETLNKDPRGRPTAEQLLNTHPFLVPKTFVAQPRTDHKPPLSLNKRFKDCAKHPGHTNFTPIKDFNSSHLPGVYCKENIVDLIKAIGDLTLQVFVKSDGDGRPTGFQNGKNGFKIGTGYVYRVDMTSKSKCKCRKCKISETPSMVWWEVVVITSTSVVCDGTEAGNVVCRAFFDDITSRAHALDGVHVVEANSKTQRCIMKCASCDNEIIHLLMKRLEQAEALRGRLMQSYLGRKDLQSLTIIVSHPHGLAKHVTVGNWSEKFENGVEQSRYCYTTPTCPGCSGAPVFLLNRIDHKGYHSHTGFHEGIGFSGTWMG